MTRVLGAGLYLLASLIPCLSLAAPDLPFPLGRGGGGALLVPTARTDGLAAHLRGGFLLLDLGAESFRYGLHFGLSVSLWHWAEAGATWQASARNGPAGCKSCGIDVRQGPVSLWGRFSPPVFSDHEKDGWALAGQVEYAVARGSFDGGGQLAPDAQTWALITEYRKWRVSANLSGAYQMADGDRYRGVQGGAALWLTLVRSVGLQVGGEVLARVGAWPGEGLRAGWTALLGFSILEGYGIAGGGGYLRGDGGTFPASSTLITMGYSVGPGYKRPPPDPTFPPLFPDLGRWWAEHQVRRRMQAAGLPPAQLAAAGPPAPGALRAGPALPGTAYCTALSGPAAPLQVLRGCVLAGWMGVPPPAQMGQTFHLQEVEVQVDDEAEGPPCWVGNDYGGEHEGSGAAALGAMVAQLACRADGVSWREALVLGAAALPIGLGKLKWPPGGRWSFHDAPSWSRSSYAHLPEPRLVAPGLETTHAQRVLILQANRVQNGGALRSDASGQELVPPIASRPGTIHSPNEAHVDHVDPRSKGGTNSNSNVQVLSREENLKKGATP